MKVPCGSCRACCYMGNVAVSPVWDDVSRLATEPNPETQGRTLRLRTRADGACAHLTDSGCAVYEHRPMVCKLYDCRALALIGITASYENGQTGPHWEFSTRSRGEEMMLHIGRGVAGAAIRKGAEPDMVALAIQEYAMELNELRVLAEAAGGDHEKWARTAGPLFKQIVDQLIEHAHRLQQAGMDRTLQHALAGGVGNGGRT